MRRNIRKKDRFEMAEKEAIKVARSAIRLKYSVLADREINERLPEIQATVRRAIDEGRDYALDVAALFAGEAG